MMRMMMNGSVSLGLVAILLALSSSHGSAEDIVHLTKDNFAAMTEGKSVFIKFYAPWCVHSKKIAPEWEKLAADWEKSKVGLVAKVDCTDTKGGGKDLCDDNDVNGFPTIKYGDPSASYLNSYEGGRTYLDLAAFAKENLKPPCSPTNLGLCDKKTKKELQQLMKKSDKDIEALIAEERKNLRDLNTQFKARAKELEDQYNQISAEKERTIKEIKTTGLGIAKSIKDYKEKMKQSGSGDEL